MDKSLITFVPNKLITLCMLQLCEHCLTDSRSSGTAVQKFCAKEKQKNKQTPQKLKVIRLEAHTQEPTCVFPPLT